jgi:FkbM family methyltransferase
MNINDFLSSNPKLELVTNKYEEKYIIYSDDYIGKCIKDYNRFSPTEIIFLENFINESDNIIEGGTNIGSHTIPLSKFNKNGKYFCFEPQFDIYNILSQNILLNNRTNVIPYNYALGEENSIVRYKSSGLDYKNRGGFTIPTDNTNDYDCSLHIKPITDFDDIMSLDKIKLIKLDIEGYEPIVLKTMKDLIMKHKPILFVEYNDMTFKDIVNIIKSFDYSLYYFNTLCNQYNQSMRILDTSIKISDVNLVCFPNNSTYEIPHYLVRVNDEKEPNNYCFISYNTVLYHK